LTLITVQNTVRGGEIQLLPARIVAEQIQAIIEDLAPKAIKTGALGNTEIIAAVAGIDLNCPLIIDPVLTGKQGSPLLAAEALVALRTLLLPKAVLITPNTEEAAALTGAAVRDIAGMRRAAEQIAGFGPQAVLVKGGHIKGPDLLYYAGQFTEFPSVWTATRHTHGTGCTYSAAITALIAKGQPLPQAVATAHAFVAEAIRTNPGLGAGAGPINHHVNPDRL
jgi:hydroxymethylpyrimidine/phosphomethylpyrimidine kinase